MCVAQGWSVCLISPSSSNTWLLRDSHHAGSSVSMALGGILGVGSAGVDSGQVSRSGAEDSQTMSQLRGPILAVLS
jgi:hypothetical protein